MLIVHLHELERFVCQQSAIGWMELSYTCSYYSLEILSNWVCAGADNLAANFSRELADYIIYIIDVSGGDKIPRKGGPGITQADLLVCAFWYSLLQLLCCCGYHIGRVYQFQGFVCEWRLNIWL